MLFVTVPVDGLKVNEAETFWLELLPKTLEVDTLLLLLGVELLPKLNIPPDDG